VPSGKDPVGGLRESHRHGRDRRALHKARMAPAVEKGITECQVRPSPGMRILCSGLTRRWRAAKVSIALGRPLLAGRCDGHGQWRGVTGARQPRYGAADSGHPLARITNNLQPKPLVGARDADNT